MANEVVLHETRTPSMIVGCDPGKSGALAWMFEAMGLEFDVDVCAPIVGEGAA